MACDGVVGNVSKGQGHVAIDAQLNYQENGEYVRRSAIREALANPENNYVDLLRSVFFVPEMIARYMAYHWYPEDIAAPEVWWKDKQPIEPLCRHSTIEAIDLAGDLPIDSYWMPIGNRNIDRRYYPAHGLYRSDEYPFEIILTKSKYQLTRVILTPPCPVNQNAQDWFTEPSDIWVMRDVRDPSLLGDERVDREGGVKVARLYQMPDMASTE